jgi:hypothetical protein
MKPEDIRKLWSLHRRSRAAAVRAALEDQDLFPRARRRARAQRVFDDSHARGCYRAVERRSFGSCLTGFGRSAGSPGTARRRFSPPSC